MKYFVVSDVHSFLDPLKAALEEKGFDSSNDEHCLIVCGDLFDRGKQSYELLTFVMSLPRKILIRGNHEYLLEECCYRSFPLTHDKQNGTVSTIQSIGGSVKPSDFAHCCKVTLDKTQAYRDSLVNYFETKNYIFVHSWIPTRKVSVPNTADKWIPLTSDEWMEDWRNANDVQWEDAMWGNPFQMWQQGLNQTGKTIVFGHWHCSAGHRIAGRCNSEFEYAIWEPFYGEGVIAIDRCTAHTGQVNVLVLEDSPLES